MSKTNFLVIYWTSFQHFRQRPHLTNRNAAYFWQDRVLFFISLKSVYLHELKPHAVPFFFRNSVTRFRSATMNEQWPSLNTKDIYYPINILTADLLYHCKQGPHSGIVGCGWIFKNSLGIYRLNISNQGFRYTGCDRNTYNIYPQEIPHA